MLEAALGVSVKTNLCWHKEGHETFTSLNADGEVENSWLSHAKISGMKEILTKKKKNSQNTGINQNLYYIKTEQNGQVLDWSVVCQEKMSLNQVPSHEGAVTFVTHAAQSLFD